MSKKKRKQKASHEPNISVPIHGFAVKLPLEFSIPQDSRTAEIRLIAERIVKSAGKRGERQPVQHIQPTGGPDEHWLQAVVSIATNAWRAEKRLVDSETRQPRGDVKLLHRDISSILDALKGIGIEIKDQAGQTYDAGMKLHVLASEPTAGINKDIIKQTIKPAIIWQGKYFLQMADVIVGTPQTSERGETV